jgi:hypothetical protein
MRPPGDLARALASAARQPGTVRELCQRAQVGFDVGRKTASRLLQRGELEVLGVAPAAGPGRPPSVVVAAPRVRTAPAPSLQFERLRSFLEWPPDCRAG